MGPLVENIILTRHSVVMRQGYAASTFYRSDVEETGDIAASYMLDHTTWAEMGKPEVITVTVEVGDTLNG